MKRIFLLFSMLFVLFSCNNSNEIEKIETLSYFTNARNFKLYSITYSNGFTEALHKSELGKIDNYQTNIRNSLIDSIKKICRNKCDENFIFKKPKDIWYCGDLHSVKITFKNGKNLFFNYPFANEQNRQFIPFLSLFREIRKDSLQATRIDIGQIGNLILNQEKMSELAFKNDSIFYLKYFKKVN